MKEKIEAYTCEELKVLASTHYDHNLWKIVNKLATELLKARRSCFECPDCGYNVSYEEFIKEDSEGFRNFGKGCGKFGSNVHISIEHLKVQ
jgi:hypothetical protein